MAPRGGVEAPVKERRYSWLTDARHFWKTLVLFGTPIVLAPLPILSGSSAARCLYVILMMATYWMTEAIPLPITALLPFFLYPVFGVLPAKDVATHYLTDSNFVFVGSMMMALGVEESGLQERIALRILLFMGSDPRWIMLGFELATAFLSMWMSNTATTAMMVPIALAVINELHAFSNRERKQQRLKAKDSEIELCAVEKGVVFEMGGDPNKHHKELEPKPAALGDERIASDDIVNAPPAEKKLYKAILLSICYAANIGGTGTLTGTGSNIVFSGQFAGFYPHQDTISFASWMAFSMPQMIVLLFVNWVWLQILFVGFKKTKGSQGIKRILEKKYNKLGPMRFHEGITLFFFILLILMWLTRDPKVFPGWGSFFNDGYVTDGASAMFIGCMLFVVPRQKPDWFCMGSRDKSGPPRLSESLLTWSAMQHKFAWSIMLLLGGAYAMAAGVEASGLSSWMGCALSGLNSWPKLAFMALCVSCVTFLTEFSSNVATASIFIPIINTVANGMGQNPLYFLLPVTLACSFAFMLPVATPPNAIVFSARLLRVTDMALAGFVMNWLCIGVTILNLETYGSWLLSLHTVPSWDNATEVIAHHNFSC